MLDPNKVCMGCMRDIDGEERCPYCGFSLKEYEKERSARVLPAGTILNGKYLVGRVIGDGGFGITYLGLDLNLQVSVAVKEYFPVGLASRDTISGQTETVSLLAGDKKRFYQMGLNSFAEEARNLAKFREIPGVVSVNDFFYENTTAYLVMEYIRGKSLKKYLKEHDGPLPEKEVLEMMEPVLKALVQIHGQGIIHRDISPENIMLGDDGSISLIDFGAARTATGAETRSLTVLLKHGYAPVEQYQTKGRQGPWTDIYAVCATMYRMLSGILPDEAVERMVEDSVVSLEALAQKDSRMQVSHQVSRAIEKGLAVQAERRYQKAEALILDLYDSKNQNDPLEEPKTNTYFVEVERPDGGGKLDTFQVETEERPREPEDREKKRYGVYAGVLTVLVLATIAFWGTANGLEETTRRYKEDTVSSEDKRAEPDKEKLSKEKNKEKAEAKAVTPVPEKKKKWTAELIPIEEADIKWDPVRVEYAEASSTIVQPNNTNNTPYQMFDDLPETTWQEGVDGPGIGETVMAQFDRVYSIEYMTFRLGNWKNDKYYKGNNRPKTLGLTLGDKEFEIEFPDGKEEFCVRFTPRVECSVMAIEIKEVYPGAEWDDTCISDIGIYGGVPVKL